MQPSADPLADHHNVTLMRDEGDAVNLSRRRAVADTIKALILSSGFQPRTAMSAMSEGDEFFLRLLKSNDDTVRHLLSDPPGPRPRILRVARGGNVAALMSSWCSPESSFYKSEKLIPAMEKESRVFLDAQHPDGTLDAGNLFSPPDTSFVVEALADSLTVARRARNLKLRRTEEILTRFLLGVGRALLTGGVHTPNHRWVVCSALARINSLFPDRKYVDRIDDWLGEGIYQDADGLFPERSPNYGRVEVDAFVTLSRLLKRPALLDPVRKHLLANIYLMQPDGEMEIVNSRRQDQARPIHVANFCLQYRYMAIHDNNPTFAAVSRLIAARPGEGFIEGSNPVLQFLEEPLLRKSLPDGGTIPSDYVKVFANSDLVRIRRGDRAASIYGGDDRLTGIASGLSSNPTFFNFRAGNAILDSVRMGGQFFGLGVFRAEGVVAEGKQYVLQQRYEAPYYQPLPKEFRNPAGDYPLTPAKDGRFWSKLDFPHRPVSNVQTLDQKVTVVEKSGAFELHFEITGHDRVPYTVELAFRPGGNFEGSVQETELSGVAEAYGSGAPPPPTRVWFLKQGAGRYRVGKDVIEFGPGLGEHDLINFSGLSYQAHGARMRTPGSCVYITGYTPFRRVITIRAV